MDRIEELLRKLCSDAVKASLEGWPEDRRLAKRTRDALRQQIADEWRAMAEALEQIATWMAEDDGPLYALWENMDIGSFENVELEWTETLQMIHDGKGIGGYGDPLPVVYYRQVQAALARAKGSDDA